MAQFKEHPILFSGPMVRAILGGRKTQTRRVLKGSTEFKGPYNPAYLEAHRGSPGWKTICPYGIPGDRLWVREAFQKCGCDACRAIWPAKGPHGISAYREGYRGPSGAVFNPSIFMPRWASRIMLEITDVRVQRLQEIGEEDAIAEGIRIGHYYCDEPDLGNNDPDDCGVHRCQPREDFRILWDSINAKNHPWASNPWVWCLSFRRA